ncbi:hypothetical protein ACFFGH_33885 [Lysobacter korlensis]|uniref:Uncharacterized protein n=1 Tax=Lysobacter korlensis TaxID=553636 RepID=A0ABV6S0U7_9GAMM
MRFWKQLVATQAVATGALIATAGLAAAYGALGAARSPGMFSSADSAQIWFFGTFTFGILPVTFFGVPLYVWLSRTGHANWLSVSAIALIPAALLLLVEIEMGLIALLCAPVRTCGRVAHPPRMPYMGEP